jgi:hypothetical protein
MPRKRRFDEPVFPVENAAASAALAQGPTTLPKEI